MEESDKKLERLNVQLDPETRNKLNDLAAVTGWSVAEIIRLCISEGFAAVEQKALTDPKVKARLEEAHQRGLKAAKMLRTAQSMVREHPKK